MNTVKWILSTAGNYRTSLGDGWVTIIPVPFGFAIQERHVVDRRTFDTAELAIAAAMKQIFSGSTAEIINQRRSRYVPKDSIKKSNS